MLLDYQLRTKLYFAFVHVNLLLKISFQKASEYEEIQWNSLQNSITKLFAHQTYMKLKYSLLKMSASNKMNTLQIRQRMVNADFYFLHLFPHAVKMYINIFIMYIDYRYFRIEIIKLDMKTALLKKSTPILRELTNVTTCIFISINVPLTLEHLVFPSLATSELQNLMGFKS